ncbi:ribonuclease III [Desulfurivibrio alkaliphilus]|uniref:Ribonuclease 3 n=1 Tax=Desulfurivibrio alkaliphilus (strain DSM 19089 / UNIQEM U267 / AHT2) TaxID=589865 RepID=D6Z280_DESAT|nr:ribonuclease III [Desulfurivibrio alkaliphilus]ADH85655.1 ribonuclease III [Desulfurivibrio alkaliphilus AHT 2]
MATNAQLIKWSQRLGYCFHDPQLLRQALTHRSFTAEGGGRGRPHNERLEFLGDAVLDLAVGELLYRRHPKMREGELSRRRAALVNEAHLARMARRTGLDELLLLGRGEAQSGGRDKPSILADAFEALLGAVYLDGGCRAVLDLAAELFAPWVTDQDDFEENDAKTALQEVLQERHGQAPGYRLVAEEGPAHDKRFTVEVEFRGRVMGQGKARSKKEAEQAAARAALKTLAGE